MKTLPKMLLSLSCLSCSILTAENITSWTFNNVDHGWNSDSLAKMYFHHSETQRQWAWEALSGISLSGNEKVLDFGCGDGKVSAEIARLLKNGQVLGLDVSEKMIHLAKICFPSYAFPNLEFKNSKSLILEDFAGNRDCDFVFAFAVFHLISNPLEVLKNLRNHLKPTGKLLLVIPTGKNEALYQASNEIFPKYELETPWNRSAKTGGTSMRTLDGCSFFLKEAGYEIESLKIIDTDNPFYDLEDFIAWLMGTATATWQIPSEISQSFFSDLVHRMYEINPMLIDAEGRVCFTMPRIHIIARPNF